VNGVASDQALLSDISVSIAEATKFVAAHRQCVRRLIDVENGSSAVQAYQAEAHGYAWAETYLAALQAASEWAQKRLRAGNFSELDRLIFAIGFGEYLSQLGHGICMSQDEFARPDWGGLDANAASFLAVPAVQRMQAMGRGTEPRRRLLEVVAGAGLDATIDCIDDDETLSLIRSQFRAFADDRISPNAGRWHDSDALIPLDVVEALGELGVFGLTTPEDFGGSGLGPQAMCVVTEELSRGYLGAGSLGTRAEIASELIRTGGTDEQRAHHLPAIATGRTLPTAVFTEPGAGSDLASIRTRAVRDGDKYRIYGAKTWITHAARSDLMILLARTGEAASGHRGLTMFLAPKPRGTESNAFPADGMSGSEIPTLGYRGMREYEVAFDGFEVDASCVLGNAEGQGFKQLMATFELARIQTAARAVGVAQNALELGYNYARERNQFGKSILEFPRVGNKLAWIISELAMVRILLSDVARRKATGVRCDIEAGMAKLLGARLAWSAADNALQIHGGNGYSLEYSISRVLCDARILNIFEGAAEIQAQVIARGVLERRHNQ
jgi:(2S)-methylsuccinyl-CoA dehydrogenase